MINFLCAKPPGMSLDEFQNLSEDICDSLNTDKNPIHYSVEEKYDSQLFTFEEKLKELNIPVLVGQKA